VLNATSGRLLEPSQIRYLVSQGCIWPLCDLLATLDNKIIQVALDGLDNILKVGERDKEAAAVNQYAMCEEEAGGMVTIHQLARIQFQYDVGRCPSGRFLPRQQLYSIPIDRHSDVPSFSFSIPYITEPIPSLESPSRGTSYIHHHPHNINNITCIAIPFLSLLSLPVSCRVSLFSTHLPLRDTRIELVCF
jgi:hypothetical protein